MSPFEVDANSNHGTPTVAPATATMNGSMESDSRPKISSQNFNLRNNDLANSNTTSKTNPSSTRRWSVPAIFHTISNIRKASYESASTAPGSLESTTGRNRGQSITEAIRQRLHSASISLQQSFKRQQNTNNEEATQEEATQEGATQEEIVYTEIYALNLPPWISRDKSEIDYIRRTQMEEFLGTAEESMLSCLPPLADEEDEEELNTHADWPDPTLDTANVELDQNNTETAATTPIIPQNEEATSNTQQQTISGDLRDSAISVSEDHEIFEVNEISLSIVCFPTTTETNSEFPSNNNDNNNDNNNAAEGSRANDMPCEAPIQQSHPFSYYRRPRQRV